MFFEVMREAIRVRQGLGFVRPENFDENSDFSATFWWLLNNDPDRPSKRSKRLVVTTLQEAVEGFRDASDAVKEASKENLKTHLHQKLAQFKPGHDVPYGIEEPTEEWRIGSLNFLAY